MDPFSVESPRVVDALLLLSVFLVTLLSLSKSLPVQNIISVAFVGALLSAVIEIIKAKFNLPFGHRVYAAGFGPQLFGLLPWPVPFIWVVAILNSRGVAGVLLRPWRNSANYGFFRMGTTVFLTLIFGFCLDHFARVNHYWTWADAGSAPWTNFISCAVVTMIILVAAAPWFIDKKAVPHSPPDSRPLVVWTLLIILFVANP